MPPVGDGVRVDTTIYAGYSVPIYYDSLIAKLICYGNNRDEAIGRMKSSLLSFRISGIPSTIPFHLSALSDPRFVEGSYNTSFIDEMKYLSIKEGEVAAAILFTHPKMTEYKIKDEQEQDPWIRSRFARIDSFNVFSTNGLDELKSME